MAHRARLHTQAGFTLIELSIVLVIVGIIVTMSVGFLQTARENQRFKTTETKLSTIEEALVLYAARHRRLPCPADAAAGTGTESRTTSSECAGDQQRGIVPWIALGLPQDASIDGWGNFITYRVADEAAQDNGGAEDKCDENSLGVDLTPCTPGNLTNRLDGMGLAVQDGVEGSFIMDPTKQTGAAYVLISHGRNGFGAYSATGSYRAFAANPDAGEQQNRNNNALAASYIDGQLGTFDDLVRHATIMQVAWRANLRPGPP